MYTEIQIRIKPEQAGVEETLRQIAARVAGVGTERICRVDIVRKSIDARQKEVMFNLVAGLHIDRIEEKEKVFVPAYRDVSDRETVVVVGAGPAGLFAALRLIERGFRPLVLERGKAVEDRKKDLNGLYKTGMVDEDSNFGFGEGGAGTFSDGKLTTGTHDPRRSYVMRTFVEAGAPEDILWQHKPHVGTDLLRNVVRHLREEIQNLGGEVRFGHCFSGLTVIGGHLEGITVAEEQGKYDLPCDALVLAPGHSARDTFQMLREAGAAMEQKPFAIGVRIEHPQARISQAQFGESWEKLPPADYKLVCHLPNGRSAYTFCVCPGGQIVAAASEPGGIVTNGMSNRARDGEFINGGFLVGVGPSDFGSADPLAGVAFQEIWERKAYQFGRPGYEAPAQRVGDFLRGLPTPKGLAHRSTYRPDVFFGDLRETLPDYVAHTLALALPTLDRKLHGFAAPDALVVGVETRSSSPVRILRDKTLQSNLRGLYPCGEGAGYAGGIVSAAVDGVRVAEAVAHPLLCGEMPEK